MHKSTGVDGLSAHLLSMVVCGIAPSVTGLFNYSLRSGDLHLNGRKLMSLQSQSPMPPVPPPLPTISVVIAKVFESIVDCQLYSHLTSNSLLHPSQSGFDQPTARRTYSSKLLTIGKLHWIVVKQSNRPK